MVISASITSTVHPGALQKSSTEVEAKFRIANRRMFNYILAVKGLAGFQADRPTLVRQTDTYYDTQNLDLCRRGLGHFRVRESAGRFKVTLKGPIQRQGDAFARSEDEEKLGAGPISESLGRHRLFSEAVRIVGQKMIFPVVVVSNSRLNIMFSNGRSAIEVSLDTLHYSDRSGAVVGPVFELEAENMTAPEMEFSRFVAALRKRYPSIELSSASKYERAVEALRTSGKGERQWVC